MEPIPLKLPDYSIVLLSILAVVLACGLLAPLRARLAYGRLARRKRRAERRQRLELSQR